MPFRACSFAYSDNDARSVCGVDVAIVCATSENQKASSDRHHSTDILSDLMVGGVPDTPAAASSSSHCSMTSVSNSQSKLFIPFDGAHLLVDVCPRLSETLLARGPRSFFQLGCCQQVPYEGMGGVGGALFY